MHNVIDTETALLTGLIQGNHKIFRDIFDLYARRLVFYAYRIVKEKEAAENIIQDVFINLWERREKLPSDLKLEPYLYRAVKNRCINHIKSSALFEKNDNPDLFKSESPNNIAEFNEIKESYNKAVNKLPSACKTIFLMNRIDGFTYKEISLKLNISQKTVETQMSRALKFIRKHLEKFLIFFLFFCKGS